MTTSLYSTFSALSLPEAGKYSVRPSAEWPDLLVGRDSSSFPVLLFPCAGLPGGVPQVVRLRRVAAEVGVACELVFDGEKQAGIYSVLSCLTTEGPALRTFFSLAETLLREAGSPSDLDVVLAISHLTGLLEAAKVPSMEEIVGAWGRLFVLAHAADPGKALSAWHVNPQERYDFSDAAEKVEVKTTLNSVRTHHFSLEQLNPQGAEVVVASICTSTSTGGSSIGDLVDLASSRLLSHEVSALHVKVLASLGDDWQHHSNVTFDLGAAAETLRFYAASSVPSVAFPAPAGVSQVTFVSDLSGSTPLESPSTFLATALWPRGGEVQEEMPSLGVPASVLSGSDGSLLPLLANGAVKEGEEVRLTYKGVVTTAKITAEGELLVTGQPPRLLPDATEGITGDRTSAWRLWTLERSGKRVSLAALREPLVVEALAAQADAAGNTAFRPLLLAAQRGGLHLRPYKRAVMLTPPSNAKRVLINLEVPPTTTGLLRVFASAEAWESFYPGSTGVMDVLGGEGYLSLSAEKAALLAIQLEALSTSS